MSIAISAHDRDDVAEIFQNVTFINFNYDRTIEQYLYWGLQQLAGVSREAAARAVSNLKIIRPYGSIGPLDIDPAPHRLPDSVSFGGGRGFDLYSIAENIRTFTEQIEDTSTSSSIDAALKAANVLIFLGFGFHQQNLALFRPTSDSTRRNMGTVMASVFGIDPLNHNAINRRLEFDLGLAAPKMLVPLKANQMLKELRLSISMAVG